MVPDDICNCIETAYERVCRVPQGTNPVSKIPIVVTGSDGEVYMDEIPIDKDGDVPQNNPQGVGRGRGGVGIADRPICEQLLALHSQQLAIRRMIIELGNKIDDQSTLRTWQYQTLNSNLRRIALQPAR